MSLRPPRLAFLAAALPLGAFAHLHRFPLPRPPKAASILDERVSPHCVGKPCHEETFRTRLVEFAVAAAGGWTRWREVDSLFLRISRQKRSRLGETLSNEEENLIFGPERFLRYWHRDNHLYGARIQGRNFDLIRPALDAGSPIRDEVRQEMERELFWQCHPFLLYRPGIRTRYLGIRPTRGKSCHVLRAEYDPGASPYLKVDYYFDPYRGDLLRAETTPRLAGETPEVHVFSGHVRSRSGLRVPRTREVYEAGILVERVLTRHLATRREVLPPSPFSREAARRRLEKASRVGGT